MSASSTVAQVAILSRRSVLGTFRQPQSWVPGFFFPLMLAAVYSSQFAKVVDLPTFPFEIDSFLEFILPASILQGVAFGATNGASDLAADIEGGFIDRLLASPVPRQVILVSRLAGSAIFASAQAIVLMLVFLVFGASIAGGFPAAITLVLVGALLALGLGSLGCAIAFRSGSQEVVQGTFPLIFVLIFVSSAFFPTELMEGWYGAVAERNPMTWIIDPARRLTIEEFAWSDAGQALGLCAVFAIVAIAVASGQQRRRLRTS
ncbi:MAG: ABC transporter permease [Acidimicrobiia bacterium]|nr:ABC transporter permease [Acidimicrobiia bacterium]